MRERCASLLNDFPISSESVELLANRLFAWNIFPAKGEFPTIYRYRDLLYRIDPVPRCSRCTQPIEGVEYLALCAQRYALGTLQFSKHLGYSAVLEIDIAMHSSPH